MAQIAACYADTAGFDGSTQLISTRANDSTTGGGQIYLNGSARNRIDFANVGMAAPTTGTRSAGTKICLRSNVDASNVDYAIGIESDNMWFSVPNSSSTGGFNWYAGTTRIARLNGSGAFNAKSVSAESNLYSGGNINQVGALYVGTGG